MLNTINKDIKIIKLISCLILFFFLATNLGWAQGPLGSSLVASSSSMKTIPGPLEIPDELGSIQEEYRSGTESPFIVFIQDAHMILDAQANIEDLIRHLQETYGIQVIALEGGKGALDPTLFRTFPDEGAKKKVLSGYRERGELTGAEMASILNPKEGKYYGIEDWKLYEENYLAYLRTAERREKILEELVRLKSELDTRRKGVYSEELNKFHEKVEAFHEERAHLIELLGYLKTRMSRTSRAGLLIQAAGGRSDLPPRANRAEATYPHLSVLLASIEKDSKMNKEELEAAIRDMGDGFKKKHWKAMDKAGMMEFNSRYQDFVTGRMDAASFLKALIKMSQEVKDPVKLTGGMEELLGHTETLSSIKGTKLFDELEALILEIENQMIKKEEEREISERYKKIRMLKNLAMLELTREGWETYQKDPESYRALLRVPKMLDPAQEFYRLAVARDFALQRNLLELMKREKVKSAVVLAGGFHSQGFARGLKEQGCSYALVTPRINSLKGHELYDEVMKGKLSYKDYLKTTFYDAFVRAATIKLVAELNEPDFRKALKQWRDDVIRKLAEEGRVADAGDYTKYIDFLVKAYVEKYGTKNLTDKTKDKILKDIEKALKKFQEKALSGLGKNFEYQLDQFIKGVKGLQEKKKDLTAGNLEALLQAAAKTETSQLQALRGALISKGLDADLFKKIIFGEIRVEVLDNVDLGVSRADIRTVLEKIRGAAPVSSEKLANLAEVDRGIEVLNKIGKEEGNENSPHVAEFVVHQMVEAIRPKAIEQLKQRVADEKAVDAEIADVLLKKMDGAAVGQSLGQEGENAGRSIGDILQDAQTVVRDARKLHNTESLPDLDTALGKINILLDELRIRQGKSAEEAPTGNIADPLIDEKKALEARQQVLKEEQRRAEAVLQDATMAQAVTAQKEAKRGEIQKRISLLFGKLNALITQLSQLGSAAETSTDLSQGIKMALELAERISDNYAKLVSRHDDLAESYAGDAAAQKVVAGENQSRELDLKTGISQSWDAGLNGIVSLAIQQGRVSVMAVQSGSDLQPGDLVRHRDNPNDYFVVSSVSDESAIRARKALSTALQDLPVSDLEKISLKAILENTPSGASLGEAGSQKSSQELERFTRVAEETGNRELADAVRKATANSLGTAVMTNPFTLKGKESVNDPGLIDYDFVLNLPKSGEDFEGEDLKDDTPQKPQEEVLSLTLPGLSGPIEFKRVYGGIFKNIFYPVHEKAAAEDGQEVSLHELVVAVAKKATDESLASYLRQYPSAEEFQDFLNQTMRSERETEEIALQRTADEDHDKLPLYNVGWYIYGGDGPDAIVYFGPRGKSFNYLGDLNSREKALLEVEHWRSDDAMANKGMILFDRKPSNVVAPDDRTLPVKAYLIDSEALVWDELDGRKIVRDATKLSRRITTEGYGIPRQTFDELAKELISFTAQSVLPEEIDHTGMIALYLFNNLHEHIRSFLNFGGSIDRNHWRQFDEPESAENHAAREIAKKAIFDSRMNDWASQMGNWLQARLILNQINGLSKLDGGILNALADEAEGGEKERILELAKKAQPESSERLTKDERKELTQKFYDFVQKRRARFGELLGQAADLMANMEDGKVSTSSASDDLARELYQAASTNPDSFRQLAKTKINERNSDVLKGVFEILQHDGVNPENLVERMDPGTRGLFQKAMAARVPANVSGASLGSDEAKLAEVNAILAKVNYQIDPAFVSGDKKFAPGNSYHLYQAIADYESRGEPLSPDEYRILFDFTWQVLGKTRTTISDDATFKYEVLRDKLREHRKELGYSFYMIAMGHLEGGGVMKWLPFNAWLTPQERRFLWSIFQDKWPESSNRPNYIKDNLPLVQEAIDRFGRARVLDVGSGPKGAALVTLKDSEYGDRVDALGIDMHVEKDHDPRIQLTEGDAAQLPYEKESIHLAFESNLLQYFTADKEKFKKLLGEIFRVLAPGGKFISTDIPMYWRQDDLEKIMRELGVQAEVTLEVGRTIIQKKANAQSLETKLAAEPSFAMIPKEVLLDERMSSADTIKQFLLEASHRDREILRQIVSSLEFVSMVLSGKEGQIALSPVSGMEKNDLPRLNQLLKELSFRIHIETGSPYYVWNLSGGKKTKLALKIKKWKEEEQGAIWGDFVPEPPPTAVKVPAIQVSKDSIGEFTRIIQSDDKGRQYQSSFAGTIQDIAVLTHNRDGVVETVRRLAENLAAFGHKKVRIHILDDSSDGKGEERWNQIRKSVTPYEKNGTVEVIYFGAEAREQRKRALKDQIRKSPFFESEKLEKKDLDRMIDAALGASRGVGANRNWAMLEMGGRDFIMLDDDVHPYANAELDGKPLGEVPIDLLTVLSRSMAMPGVIAADMAYSGYVDHDVLTTVMSYMKRMKGQTHPLASPVHGYGFGQGKTGPQFYVFYNPEFTAATQGGALALAAKTNGIASRIPSPTTAENYLRWDDFLIGNIGTLLSHPLPKERYSKGNGYEDINLVYRPGSAVTHARELSGRSTDVAQVVLNEAIGRYLFSQIFFQIFRWSVLPDMGLQDKPILTEEEKLKAISVMGRNIQDYLHISGYGRIESDFFLSDGLSPLQEPLKELGRTLEELMEVYRENKDLTEQQDPERYQVVQSIKKLFERSGWETYLGKERIAWLDQVNWKPIQNILKQELGLYADTLIIWPHLLSAAHADIGKLTGKEAGQTEALSTGKRRGQGGAKTAGASLGENALFILTGMDARQLTQYIEMKGLKTPEAIKAELTRLAQERLSGLRNELKNGTDEFIVKLEKAENFFDALFDLEDELAKLIEPLTAAGLIIKPEELAEMASEIRTAILGPSFGVALESTRIVEERVTDASLKEADRRIAHARQSLIKNAHQKFDLALQPGADRLLVLKQLENYRQLLKMLVVMQKRSDPMNRADFENLNIPVSMIMLNSADPRKVSNAFDQAMSRMQSENQPPLFVLSNLNVPSEVSKMLVSIFTQIDQVPDRLKKQVIDATFVLIFALASLDDPARSAVLGSRAKFEQLLAQYEIGFLAQGFDIGPGGRIQLNLDGFISSISQLKAEKEVTSKAA